MYRNSMVMVFIKHAIRGGGGTRGFLMHDKPVVVVSSNAIRERYFSTTYDASL